ncbi:10993_t:CDS:2 [Acaulospora morrowiae]|uniref:10993_t:CDS:1 n=1 Tax=Acaulospora morrowiae TaxID=94023 RepID=A0A9N9AH38_9GLOM|nr:10993_t:CDS:2 [Acaulospora morrowiae]
MAAVKTKKNHSQPVQMHSNYFDQFVDSLGLYDGCTMECTMGQDAFGETSSSSSSNVSTSVENTPVLPQDPQLTLVKPTFPPLINVDELVPSRPNGEKPSKSSNAFIIYRKAYVKELHMRGINLQMTQISPMVSESWKQEPEDVKKEYKRLAEAAKKRYKELWPSKQGPGLESSQDHVVSRDSSSYSTQPQLALGNNWETPFWQSPLIDPMFVELDAVTSHILDNNDNAQTSNSIYPSSSSNDIPTSERNDNGSLINLLVNKRSGFALGSMPEPTDRKGSVIAYHQLMTNWHKDLSRHSSHPYHTFNDAMSVSFFTIHLV